MMPLYCFWNALFSIYAYFCYEYYPERMNRILSLLFLLTGLALADVNAFQTAPRPQADSVAIGDSLSPVDSFSRTADSIPQDIPRSEGRRDGQKCDSTFKLRWA